MLIVINITKMSKLHAYFSNTQKLKNGIVYIYFKEDGTKVECSEVSPHKQMILQNSFQIIFIWEKLLILI